MVAYAIKAAFDSGCFDEVMVSTDDPEIADCARSYGATVPFMRSREASSDTATTSVAIGEVLEGYQNLNKCPAIACGLYPTVPLLSPESIRNGRRMLDSDTDLITVISVARYGHPIQRALRLSGARLEAIAPEAMLKRTQDLEASYHDAAQFYWLRVKQFLADPHLIGSRTGAIILRALEVQDIDTEEDWLLAEAKYYSTRRKP